MCIPPPLQQSRSLWTLLAQWQNPADPNSRDQSQGGHCIRMLGEKERIVQRLKSLAQHQELELTIVLRLHIPVGTPAVQVNKSAVEQKEYEEETRI